jgi:hypothetical protein
MGIILLFYYYISLVYIIIIYFYYHYYIQYIYIYGHLSDQIIFKWVIFQLAVFGVPFFWVCLLLRQDDLPQVLTALDMAMG